MIVYGFVWFWCVVYGFVLLLYNSRIVVVWLCTVRLWLCMVLYDFVLCVYDVVRSFRCCMVVCITLTEIIRICLVFVVVTLTEILWIYIVIGFVNSGRNRLLFVCFVEFVFIVAAIVWFVFKRICYNSGRNIVNLCWLFCTILTEVVWIVVIVLCQSEEYHTNYIVLP